ncbi:hypothetical protein Droror1_Dr00012113, partial [Drosera rotundifolia]
MMVESAEATLTQRSTLGSNMNRRSSESEKSMAAGAGTQRRNKIRHEHDDGGAAILFVLFVTESVRFVPAIYDERDFNVVGIPHKFVDSLKLKPYFLRHTGEKDFVCPHEGCGKAFSLDFNLRSHMKTHSQENYHFCPYSDCGRRYTHEYKLKSHIISALTIMRYTIISALTRHEK